MTIRFQAAAAALFLAHAASLSAQSAAGTITLSVQYSPAAMAAMQRNHYQMTAHVTVEGDPVRGRERYADDMSGTIDLGMIQQPIPATPGPHPVALTGLNRARLPWVREARVNVGIAPQMTDAQIRRAGPADTIICNGPSGLSLTQAMAAPVPVTCQAMPEVR